MKELILVFIGGGLGSCLRYVISIWLNPITALLPLGTLLSNVFACLILGFFTQLLQTKIIDNEQIKFFVMVGICGGFSTFSTFSNELFTYLKNAQYLHALAYTLASLFLCFLGIFLGFLLGKNVQ